MVQKTRKELEEVADLQTTIRRKQQVIDYFTIGDYFLADKQIDMYILFHVLLQFSVNGKTLKPITDGIRAVTFLMEDTYALHIADRITDMVKKKIEEQIKMLSTSIGDMREVVEHVRDAAKTITGKMDNFADDFQESAKQLAKATQELTEKTTKSMKPTQLVPNPAPITYTLVTQQQTSPEQREIIVRGECLDRQIIIEKDKNSTNNNLADLSKKT